MPALYLVIPALCVGAIAYRYYSAFIAAKVMVLDDTRQTPAHAKYDGANFYPTQRWVLFGHHFASITGAGPLLGPVLAARRAGLRRIILPRGNQKDLRDLPEEVRKELEFVFADRVADVLTAALPDLAFALPPAKAA